MLLEFFAQWIPPSPFRSRAQFVNLGKISRAKKMPGCPIVPTTGEVNEIVDVILNTQITCRPFSGAEGRGIIEKKYQKTMLLDTLHQILRRDGRVTRDGLLKLTVPTLYRPIEITGENIHQ
jgi:hypothetical protein